ncbi:MAG: FG-GAP-like repeat-containing protein [Salinibacter sp.]
MQSIFSAVPACSVSLITPQVLANRLGRLLLSCCVVLAVSTAEAQSQQFSDQKVITTSADGAQSVYAEDLDGDSDADVLSASENDDKIAWYENKGDGTFSEQKIITTNADGAQSVYARDLDGDSDVDVLSASRDFSDEDKIAWYENDGEGSFSEQKIITTNVDGAQSVYARDLDGDSDVDVLSASENDGKIAWYENEGDGSFSSQNVITTNAASLNSIYAHDLNGDGAPDVVSASGSVFDEDKIAWYENDGEGSFSEQKIITMGTDGPGSVYARDLDGDSDADVLSTSGPRGPNVEWYENEGGGTFSEQKGITGEAVGPQSVYARDLDGDSDTDVLSASTAYLGQDKIAWYENEGDGTFSDQKVITTSADEPQSVYAKDLDGDSDTDVLSVSDGDNKIAWYERYGRSKSLATPFTDNFDDNSIDPTKWETTGRGGPDGDRVAEENGVMKVEVRETDNGGILKSKWVRVSTDAPIQLSQETKVHYANDKFSGDLQIHIEGKPDKTFGVSYANYNYSGGQAEPLFGIHLFRNAANPNNECCQDDVSEGIDGIWDQWFNEDLIYDPQTGDLRYLIADTTAITYDVGAVPNKDSISIRLEYQSYGWYTGHYIHLDDFALTQRSGSGLITGRVEDAQTGDPVAGATVRLKNVSGRKAKTSARGKYQISVPPGTRYTLVATGEEYFATEQPFVDVRAGKTTTVDLKLRPAGQADPTLGTLTPNPNPEVSSIGTGGELIRYYRVTDGVGGPPLPDRRVTVSGGSGGPRTYRTDASGIVAVGIPASAIGGAGSSATFHLKSVAGNTLPKREQRTFTAEVKSRFFRKTWSMRSFGQVGLAGLKGGGAYAGRTSLLGTTAREEASALQIHRRKRGNGGVGFGIGTPQIRVGETGIGAGASTGSSLFFYRGDAHRFDRQKSTTTKEAAARFYTWARSNFAALKSNNLIRLLAFVADNFVFEEELRESYRFDEFGFGNQTYASASFQAGVGTLTELNLGVKGGISGDFEAYGSQKNRVGGIREISGQLEAGASVEGGASTLSLLDVDPSGGGSGEGQALRRNLSDLSVGFDQIGGQFETELRGQYELGAGCRQGETKYLFVEAGARAKGPLGHLSGLSYPEGAEGVTTNRRYQFPVGPALRPAWSGPDGNETAGTLAGACAADAALTIGRSTFSGLVEALGGQASAASAGPELSYSPVQYEVDSTLTRSEAGFKLSLPLAVVSVGVEGSFAERSSATVEEGIWAQGRHFPTKQYDTLPGLSTTYKEVVGGLLRDIKPDWWKDALDFFDPILNPIFGKSFAGGEVADSTYTYQIGDNGTTVIFDWQAVPSEVDSIQGVSWGWWGAKTSTTAQDLAPKARRLKTQIKAAAEEEEGMHYGIGGFYRLRPLGTPLQDTTTIEFHYSEEELGTADESELAAYWKDTEAGRWRFIGGVVDAEANTVTAPIDTFRTFTLAPRLPTGSFGLDPGASSIEANGTASTSVQSNQLSYNDGSPVQDGALYTVETDRGQIATPDADTTRPGTQVRADGGQISFEVKAGRIAGTATVKARSVRGQSVGEGSLELKNTGPPSPVSITSVEARDESVVLSWEEAPEPDVGGYKVYFGSDSTQLSGVAAEGRTSPVDVGDVTETRISGLSNDTTTFVAVSAYDVAGAESARSAARCVVPADTVSPGPPSRVRLAPAEDTVATLSWTAPGDNGTAGRAFAYQVRYGEAPVQDTSQWWAQATPISVLQSPSPSGTEDQIEVPEPRSDSARYAVRVVDESKNRSPIRFPEQWGFVEKNEKLGFPGAGVHLRFTGVDRSDMVSVQKFQEGPVAADSIPERNVSDYRFVIEAGESLAFDSTEVHFAVSGLSGIDNPVNVRVYKRPEVGRGPFTPLTTRVLDNGTPEDISDDTLSVRAGTFSEFVFASDTEPLPVELAQFEAQFDGEKAVRLRWTTASETGNADFRVQRRRGAPSTERASTGKGWKTIGKVEGQGTTTDPTSYQFTDTGLPYEADVLTYRLKQVDMDGSASYSKEVSVKRTISEPQLLGTYPNPARRQATLRYAIPERQEVTIHLYDVLGRRVKTIVDGKLEGRQKMQVDVSRLASGVYFLRLMSEGETRTKKLTVVR